MGLFGKLMFWKKEDDFSFDVLADKEMQKAGIPPADDLGIEHNRQIGIEESSSFEEPVSSLPPVSAPSPLRKQQPLSPSAPQSNSQLELISSKLDTIKAILDSMERRLASLEGTEQRKKLW